MSGPGAAETRPPADIPYRLAWRSPSPRAGVHRGRHDGSGGRFRDLVPILNHPDPRRVDLRATIRDPSAQLFVRRFDQPAAIALYALLDVSASMGVGDGGDKLGTASALVGALAASARKAGDAFGLIGFDGALRADLAHPARRGRAAETELPRFVASATASGRGAAGLADAAALLGARRKLVFVISDFHWTPGEIATGFQALASHDVVMVALCDAPRESSLPEFGLMALRDAETGMRRIVLMRPSLRAKWRCAEEARQEALDRASRRFGRAPFRVAGAVDWDRLTDYLMSGAS
jgi:uncharacterized protein (DUF58 family)